MRLWAGSEYGQRVEEGRWVVETMGSVGVVLDGDGEHDTEGEDEEGAIEDEEEENKGGGGRDERGGGGILDRWVPTRDWPCQTPNWWDRGKLSRREAQINSTRHLQTVVA